MADKQQTSSDTAKSGAAAQEVFDTPELCEMILLNLNVIQICGVQRTCKAFRETTNGSINLKRAMYLEADPNAVPSNDNINPVVDNLIVKSRRVYSCGGTGLLRRDETRRHLSIQFDSWSSEAPYSPGRRTFTHSENPEASWRRMFAIQPPEFPVDVLLLKNYTYWHQKTTTFTSTVSGSAACVVEDVVKALDEMDAEAKREMEEMVEEMEALRNYATRQLDLLLG